MCYADTFYEVTGVRFADYVARTGRRISVRKAAEVIDVVANMHPSQRRLFLSAVRDEMSAVVNRQRSGRLRADVATEYALVIVAAAASLFQYAGRHIEFDHLIDTGV